MTIRPVAESLFPDLRPPRPVDYIVESVQFGTNADLIEQIAPLYLTGSVLDVTYGQGKWWDRYRPDDFTFHDLRLDGVDFRDLPYPERSFDTVCFDPPYVLSGTASSARLGPDFQDRYGIGEVNFPQPVGDTGRAALHQLILDGFAEACHVARSWVLVKCMEYAQGGGFHDVPMMVSNVAADHGCVKHDQIVHATGVGPGGHNIYDVKRARRAHSYLLVFEVPQ